MHATDIATHAARQALSLMDLTSLNAQDTEASTRALAASAATPYGAPAALCVYAPFVETARNALDEASLQAVRVAAVANFPGGGSDAEAASQETARLLALGADEVDVVFPWRALQAGDAQAGARLVAACKAQVRVAPASTTRGPRLLKVILETGELQSPALIRQATEVAIAAGADFVKTSTGKVAINATLPAARVMLEAIRDSGRVVGFKASGGVRTVEDARAYLALAEQVMGTGWVSARTFRFGASGLLAALMTTLRGAPASATRTSGY